MKLSRLLLKKRFPLELRTWMASRSDPEALTRLSLSVLPSLVSIRIPWLPDEPLAVMLLSIILLLSALISSKIPKFSVVPSVLMTLSSMVLPDIEFLRTMPKFWFAVPSVTIVLFMTLLLLAPMSRWIPWLLLVPLVATILSVILLSTAVLVK